MYYTNLQSVQEVLAETEAADEEITANILHNTFDNSAVHLQ
jgi:hypothetical protein